MLNLLLFINLEIRCLSNIIKRTTTLLPGGVEYTDCTSIEVLTKPSSNECAGYGTKPSDSEDLVLKFYGT